MSVRLFVGNLSYDVTEGDVATLFGEVGVVKMVRLPVDRESGRPRGFAFVEYAEAFDATEAMNRFNQQVFMGRQLVVNAAVPRDDSSRWPSRPTGAASGGEAPYPNEAARHPAPARTFGPDSLPQNKRNARGGRSSASENRAKAPLKEIGAKVWSRHPDDNEGDDVPFWAVHDDQPQEKE